MKLGFLLQKASTKLNIKRTLKKTYAGIIIRWHNSPKINWGQDFYFSLFSK